MTQVDITTFKANTASLYPDNTSGLISPADLRAQMDNIVDSAALRVTGKTAGPSVTDDGVGTGGNGDMTIGQIWIDETADEAYICLDNTPGAAVWVRLNIVNDNLQVQDETTTTSRRIQPDESGYSYEMNNVAANTIEIIGEKEFTITGATQANPCVITVADTTGLETGDTGSISGVSGMTELNALGTITITVIDGTTFSLDGVDSTAFTPYASGGLFTRDAFTYPEGFQCEIIQTGSGTTTLQVGAAINLNGISSSPVGVSGDITAQWGVIRLRKISDGGWVVDGDISAIA
jgi:hypothetical protein